MYKKYNKNFLFNLIKPYILKILTILIFILASTSLNLVFPIVTKYVIDDVIINRNLEKLTLMLVYLAVLSILSYLFSFLTQYFSCITGEHLAYRIKKHLFIHINKIPLIFFNKARIGEILSCFNVDISVISKFFITNVPSLLNDIITIIVIIVILFYLNINLAFLCIIFLPFFYFSILLSKIVMKKRFKIIREIISEENNQIHNNITNIKLIKLFILQKKVLKDFIKIEQKLIREKIKSTIYSSILSQIVNIIALACPMVILWYGTNLVFQTKLTVGGLMAFFTYINRLYIPIKEIVNINTQFQNVNVSFERIFEKLNENIEDYSNSTCKIKEGIIQYEQISLYIEGEKILTNISLHIKAGEKIAIIGKNGSGKTSLVNLLLKFYEPSAGEIFIDNTKISEYSTYSIRKDIGVVTQENYFFNSSIIDNLRISNNICSKTDIINACKLTNADDFITHLPNNYNTLMGERGCNLSGGQLQKLAITRLILKKPRIVIFDEAESSLDYEGTLLFYNLFNSIFRDSTIIFITHDLDNIFYSDRIILLNNGTIEQEYCTKSIKNNEVKIAELRDNIA